jgi:hypothetical protein
MTKPNYEVKLNTPAPVTRWSKTVSIGDTREEINVTKAENGFVVNYYKSYYDKKRGYQSIEKTWISKTNPLSDVDAETPGKTALKDIINALDE